MLDVIGMPDDPPEQQFRLLGDAFFGGDLLIQMLPALNDRGGFGWRIFFRQRSQRFQIALDQARLLVRAVTGLPQAMLNREHGVTQFDEARVADVRVRQLLFRLIDGLLPFLQRGARRLAAGGALGLGQTSRAHQQQPPEEESLQHE